MGERENIPIGQTVTREVTSQDLDRLITFDERVVFGSVDYPPDHLPGHLSKIDLDKALSRGDILRAAFDLSGEIAAYYWFELQHDKDRLYIASMIIDPKYWDMGVGGKILDIADTIAKANGLSKCVLSVDPFNGRAVNAYLKHGYQMIGYEEDYFGPEVPNSDRFLMEKNLVSIRSFQGREEETTCDNPEQIKRILEQGYIGTGLIRAPDKDNTKNTIVFRK